jgi:hypothetical protein
MLATALADVLVGDDHPAVALGSGDHLLEQAAVGLLDVGAPGELGLGVAESARKRVADALELAGGEHPRAADRADAPLEAGTREGGGEQLAEPAVERGDLAPQVLARAPLRGLGDRPARQDGAGCRRQVLGLIERA